MTLISAAFAPLAQMIARRLGRPGLPIVVVAHPVGDPDLEKVRQKGVDAMEACVHALVTPAEALVREFLDKKFRAVPHVVPKF